MVNELTRYLYAEREADEGRRAYQSLEASRRPRVVNGPNGRICVVVRRNGLTHNGR